LEQIYLLKHQRLHSPRLDKPTQAGEEVAVPLENNLHAQSAMEVKWYGRKTINGAVLKNESTLADGQSCHIREG
jgi:hypothetical protein